MNQNPSSKPASAAEISEALRHLFDANLPFQRGAKSDGVAMAYIESLQGMTVDAIQYGIKRFLRGEVEDVSARYVPTPPELARICRTSVVPFRIPVERRIPAPVQTASERARMRLKMPMYQFANATSRMEELDRANRAGFRAMVVLATQWGIPIPEELLEGDDAATEREWHAARNRAWAEIERNPPPFLRHQNNRSA